MKRNKRRQHELPFKFRGGRRKGSGRKPNGERAGVSHRKRARLAARFPVHVTSRLISGLPSLRSWRARSVVLRALEKGKEVEGFRLVHFSIQSNHLHLIVEAQNAERLARGLQGLFVRIARAVNKLWLRRGRVFGDRYHAKVLKSPRQVRHALIYVLQNARKHGVKLARALDVFASGRWFTGWRDEALRERALEPGPKPVAEACTWLLTFGWLKHGLIGLDELPKSAPG